MNKKTIITALLALVTMTGQAQSRVHYRLEGFIGDSTITGKAYLMEMFVHSGEIVDTVNISKGRVIKQRNITYPQLLNTGNQYAEAYGILALPYAIIFAPDGKIIARDIRGDDIDKKLAEIFGE